MINNNRYDPVLYKLAQRGLPVFCRVINFLRSPNDNIAYQKLKNNSEFFLIAEANLWDLYEGSTSSSIFLQLRNKIDRGYFLTKDRVCASLGEYGYLSDKEVERERLRALILIKHLL